MKVLSIKEPFASLIKEGYKKIETRSFKTNYRGEIYIHASIKKVTESYEDNIILNNLMKKVNYNYGNIICKANLVDCKLMDEKFLEEIKNNSQEESLGIYKLGRYAWILEDVEVIESIPAKGNLNIWQYYTEEEILNMLPNKSLEEIITLTKKYMRNNKNSSKTYKIVYNNEEIHKFITFEKNKKIYWFEYYKEEYRGLNEYSSYEALFKDLKIKFNDSIVIEEVR